MKEISGIQLSLDGNFLYTHEDHGNENEIYVFNLKGELLRKVRIDGAVNKDWEDISQDKQGFTYIGDFGNNDNLRENLAIYKVKIDAADHTPVLQTTTFYYPEQTGFPPRKKELFYDCEAFFEHRGFFYLFTKNRSKGFDSTSLIYKIPNKPGYYKAELLGKLKPGGNFDEAAITGADISPDGKTVALITHQNVLLLEDYQGDDFVHAKIRKIDLEHTSQKEGICFKGNHQLLIADERASKIGGFLYQLCLN
ncbi:hypothetical protein [Elizabethkingia argenteiflava]|nr:hypothetical protein [Elizabethkingia argenteiflava]